jgi:pSer/pThr/pTyr-binding forkhead associated (FHA) protein
MQIVLAIFRAGAERRSYSITRDVVMIGRRQDCDLRIALAEVSRKHCRLVREGGMLRLEDLGSSNGTYLNGERVFDSELAAGDRIQVGPVVFLVQIDGAPPDEELNPGTLSGGGAEVAPSGSGLNFTVRDSQAAEEGREEMVDFDPNAPDEAQG